MSTEVRNNPEKSRYELIVDGNVVGLADYHRNGGTTVFPHTEVDPEYRRKGYAAMLVRTALDDERAAHRTVVPACAYVAHFIETNAEYADLLAS